MSSLQKDLLKSHLPHHKPDIHKLNFEPLPWNNFFDKKEILEIENNKYCVYSVGSKGPILYLIHGGGFSSLSWALFAHEITKLVDCRCIAVDLRGHGETKTCNDDDLSIDNLTKDAADVMNHLFSQLDGVDLVLVGHSMGGAIAVHLANLPKFILHIQLSALIVVDVVEGTALESLGGMQGFLRARPKYFESTTRAIEWSVKTGQIKNVDSARVSVPGQLEKIEDPGPEYFTGGRQTPLSSSYVKLAPKFDSIPEIVEDQQDPRLSSSKPPLPAKSPTPSSPSSSNASPVCGSSLKSEEHPKTIYVWRAHLEKTEKYWEGWFKGLSSMFVHTPLPKLIVLAGVDHLDKELTIGQMQGKFQMAILAKCGHSVQEDLPEEMAEIVASFLTKHKMANFLNPHFAPLQASC